MNEQTNTPTRLTPGWKTAVGSLSSATAPPDDYEFRLVAEDAEYLLGIVGNQAVEHAQARSLYRRLREIVMADGEAWEAYYDAHPEELAE